VDTRNALAPFIRHEQDRLRAGKISDQEWKDYLLHRMGGYGLVVNLTEARELASRHMSIPPHIEAAHRMAIAALTDLTNLINLELEHE
jgi:hypothetical protein